MAANDKILPTALLIANNLKGTKYSTSRTYKLTPKPTGKYNNLYTDAVEFLASLYAKELKVADFNAIWNFRNADDSPNEAPYTPNKNANFEILGQIVAFSEMEWEQLQVAISKAFNHIYPFNIPALAGVYTPQEQAEYNKMMGVFPAGSGATAPILLANGTPVPGSPFPQGPAYAAAWNSLKVPGDAALDVETYFIAPILNANVGVDPYYYRYTGKRAWESPFSGYDLY